VIQLDPAHFAIVQKILQPYPYKFYAFGSRIKHEATQFSDLDIAYEDNIPDHVISEIEEQFENSDLPIKVEIVRLSRLPEKWQNIIKREWAEIGKEREKI